MKKNLLYFCNGISSVFDSQVLELLNAIAEKYVFGKIVLFLGIKNDAEKVLLKQKNINSRIEVVLYRSFPNYPFFNKSIQKEIKSALLSFDGELEDSLFHTRGELVAFHVLQAYPQASQSLIADVRGASVEEVKEYFNQNRWQKILKVFNYKKALRELAKDAKIVAVSDALKYYLLERIPVYPDAISTIPGLAGRKFFYAPELRDKKRKELNIEKDEILFVFSSGGEANWQNTKFLEFLSEKQFKILNLSRNAVDRPNVINRLVVYGEMPAYLNAADIGIIWRDPSVVNEVASPIKFSEYVCCGLPVIANNTVTSIVEYISQFGTGKIIESFESLSDNDFIQLVRQSREENAQIGRKIFSAEVVVDKYLEVYE